MKQIIKEIKKKKELSDLPDNLVEETLTNYLTKNKLSIPQNKKKKRKIIIKEVRAQLRKYAGQYQSKTKPEKRIGFLKNDQIPELLKTHLSTKERLSFYPKLIKEIKKLKPRSILDLGCGLNPIAIASKLNNKEIIYHALDIKESELLLIKEFFQKSNVKGKTYLKDIRKAIKFPKADLTLILKILDILEIKGHKYAKQIISNIKSKHIIVSFSTRTLSGKAMRFPRRFWFEGILEEKEYKYKIIKSNNEVFYIIEKL